MSSRNCQLHLSVFDHADHTEIDVRSICKPHTFFLFFNGSSTPERTPEDRAQGLESGNRNGLIAAGSRKGPNSKLIPFPLTLCFQSTSSLRSTEYFKIHAWPLLFLSETRFFK